MAGPIVVNRRQDPWSQYLPQLLFMKIRHNMDMEQEKLRIEAKKAETKEGRQYSEGQTAKKEKFELTKAGNTPVTPSNLTPEEIQKGQVGGDIFSYGGQTWRKPKFTPRTLEIEGQKLIETAPNKFAVQKPTAGKYKNVWSKSKQSYVQRTDEQIAQNPDEYGMTKAIATGMKKAGAPQISIGEKQKQQDEAFLNSPKFISQVSKDVKQLNAFDWDVWDSNQKDNAVKMEADKRVRITYPNAQYGKKNGKEGWYIKQGNDYELVVPWSK